MFSSLWKQVVGSTTSTAISDSNDDRCDDDHYDDVDEMYDVYTNRRRYRSRRQMNGDGSKNVGINDQGMYSRIDPGGGTWKSNQSREEEDEEDESSTLTRFPTYGTNPKMCSSSDEDDNGDEVENDDDEEEEATMDATAFGREDEGRYQQQQHRFRLQQQQQLRRRRQKRRHRNKQGVGAGWNQKTRDGIERRKKDDGMTKCSNDKAKHTVSGSSRGSVWDRDELSLWKRASTTSSSSSSERDEKEREKLNILRRRRRRRKED
uniref:Uncharacterized protein n=1 Tax=Ditylum brightwellii TaxID=49249 RepID=A0A7S1ZPE1_9STRA|mmetsp:Transcript_35944/g.53583  ORF Transcript_35944/g.53583 Transcript_35944/m.53583 type:complete len:263 (+) Transcript_35944:118-906(+)